MEDEPYEEHERSFKNTQHILVISSAPKASITAVIKKTPTLSENSPQENSEKRHPATEQRSLLLILGLVSNWAL